MPFHFCASSSSQICGFLSVILPIAGGLLGLIALYLVVRYWAPLSKAFKCDRFRKSTSASGLIMSDGVVGVEMGVKSNAASVVGEPHTFVPNFFFLRQNSLDDQPAPKNKTVSIENASDDDAAAAAAANSAANASKDAAITENLPGILKKPVYGQRRISKTHPACSPTFETDPIDWGDLGIKLPNGQRPQLE